jgi:hypothetical protein
MSDDLVTIRVPKELKKRMKSSDVNWSKELRDAIEQKLVADDRREAASELDRLLVLVKPGYDSTRAIRETRHLA